jgi:hypothetical protein
LARPVFGLLNIYQENIMFGFKVNITKWLRREISATELALLREEDALAESQMRVKAYRERLRRLNDRANARVAGNTKAAGNTKVKVTFSDHGRDESVLSEAKPRVGETTDDFIARRRAAVAKKS